MPHDPEEPTETTPCSGWWAGTRLAAHGMLWMVADGKPAIDGGAS